jgi:hypothetical protein
MSVITITADPDYISKAINWCIDNASEYHVLSLWPNNKMSFYISDEKEALAFALKWTK